MNWYYHDGQNQAGPISGEQLVELRRAGMITADTMVWREGMENWAAYQAAGPAVPLDVPPVSSAIPSPPLMQTAGNEAVCAECGRIFPRDEMITHGPAHVCAGCKPVFVQKLAEGVRLGIPGHTMAFRYGGFWIRFGAKFLDNLLVESVSFGFGLIIGLAGASASHDMVLVVQGVAALAGLGFRAGYNIFMVGRFGTTLGKMVCGLKVVNADGSPLSYGKATGRFFAGLLSGCPTLMIGYIIAGSDEERRTLHDRICNTRVVFKD